MNELHKKSTTTSERKPLKPSGKPVKPNKPLPSKKEGEKVLVPCSLTEEEVRQIAREEILNREIEKIRDRTKVDSLAKENG